MKTFKKITEWLETNPSDEEQKKVLSLINRGVTNQIRRAVYDKQLYLRKLLTAEKRLIQIGFETPADIANSIKQTRREIEALSKDLPQVQKRTKKTEAVEEK